MVSGGKGDGTDLASVELLYTNGSSLCSLPDLPKPRHEHTQNGPMMCGGANYHSDVKNTCVKFCGGFWNETHSSLQEDRSGHGSWASPGGLMLIGGHGFKETSEVLSDDGQSTLHWDPQGPVYHETIK